MITHVNLEKELVKLRARNIENQAYESLNEYRKMLNEEQDNFTIGMEIFKRNSQESANIDFKNLDLDRVYDLSDIKKLCIDFRLRFLDASLFKGDIPQEALQEVVKIQADEKIELSNFKIIAPAQLFQLKEKDKDPLLFLPLGNNKFYLIHKWGNDLSAFRKLLVFPFRSFTTLLGTLVGTAFVGAMLPSSSIMMGPYDTSSLPIRVIFFFYLIIALSGMTALYGYSRMKDFSENLWNSRYNH
jgi:hypothetical protein